VGNLSWFYHLTTHNEWTSPLRRLLHYPLPREGIPGFAGTRITLSNYGGEARTYLENLVLAAGGEFTKSMKQDNTHLVTARQNSEKCNAATEWNINMVNHLWLEESYAKCQAQRLTDPRYNHFPPRTNLGEIIGETEFQASVLEDLYYPQDPTPSPSDRQSLRRQAMSEKDRNTARFDKPTVDVAMIQQEEEPGIVEAVASGRKSNPTSKLDIRTPAPTRRISSVGKENDTPTSTGSRSAKAKAMSRLHGLAPDILLYEKERKRKGPVWGGERAANKIEREQVLERSSSPASKREVEEEFSEEEEEEQEEEQARNPKRPKITSKPPVDMRLMITGYKVWLGNPAKEDLDKVISLLSS